MSEENMMIDGEGNFTDAGKAALSSEFGDDHADFKGFEGVNNLGTLGKMYADTKTMVGKKMENVIQKPGENATDEQKAEYRAALNAANGVPEDPDGYIFDKEGIPEGLEISEAEETMWKEAFKDAGVSTEGGSKLFEAYKQARVAEAAEYQKAIDTAYQSEVAALKDAWKGDAIIENPRIAFNAINAFCDDELKDVLKNAGVFSDPANLDKWRKAGITPSQLHIWGNIGKAMKSGTVLPSSNGGPNAGDDSPRAQAMRQYPNSPELWPKE